jgi:hypothetical protein
MYTWIRKLFSCCYIIEDDIVDYDIVDYEYPEYINPPNEYDCNMWYQSDMDSSLDYIIYD